MKKVIYVSFSRLTDRIARDWFIDYLITNDVVVEFWDIVPLVREEHIDFGMISPEYLHTIRSFKEFENLLYKPQNRDAFYVMLISYSGRFAKIFRLLSKHNCRMLFIAQGAMPVIDRPRSWKIANHLYNPLRLLRIIIDNVKAKAFRRLNLVKPFDTILFVGKVMRYSDQYSKKMVPINQCDFDIFKAIISDKNKLVRGRYAVFLDINAANHADLAFNNLKSLNPINYFSSINHFFGLLEAEKNIKIVIAAHPTSKYNDETFQGRKIYRLSTAKLVRDAEFVITHHSTSLSYAVLNLKSIVFCYTDEMLSVYKETIIRHIYAQAEYLGSQIYNVNKITHGKQVVIKNANVKCYENYKYDFLTSPESQYMTSQEIFLNVIKVG